MKRLREKLAPTIVEIDYSFNEWASKADREPLGDGVLLVYSFHDLIAEKFRAVLQQLFRHRNRYQDIYDLSLLLKMTHINISEEDKKEILDKLFKAAESREGINLCKEAMRDSELIEASRLLYDKELPSMLSNPPPFDTTYRAVRTFFESLPWPKK